jgi:cell division septum initiation protein DivIVA
MLLDKQNKIQFISKQNEFLDDIKSDYNKYYNYIAQQKRDQMSALHLLNNYINELTISGELSKNNMKDAKYEQKKILSELNTIKKSLDGIIMDTNDITSILKEKIN